MARHELSRRAFVRAAAGGAAAVGAGAVMGVGATTAAANGRLIPRGRIGLQLYSVRDKVRELGFEAVFEELSRIGFQRAEFAGYNSPASPGLTVPQLRQLMDDHGITAAGSHIGRGTLLNAGSREEEFEKAAILGMEYIGTAQDFQGNTVDAIKEEAERFNLAGEAAAQYGLKIYQHNHTHEFAPTTDQPDVRRYDVFLANTDPALVGIQLDILWAFGGSLRYRNELGEFDPVDYVNADPQRFLSFHVKDGVADPGLSNQYRDVVFGEGEIDFRTFFSSLRIKGYPLYLWEQDRAVNEQPNPPGSFGAAETSYNNMVALRA